MRSNSLRVDMRRHTDLYTLRVMAQSTAGVISSHSYLVDEDHEWPILLYRLVSGSPEPNPEEEDASIKAVSTGSPWGEGLLVRLAKKYAEDAELAVKVQELLVGKVWHRAVLPPPPATLSAPVARSR